MDRPTLVRNIFRMQEEQNISDKQLIMMIASSANLETLRDIIIVMLMEDELNV